MTDLKDIAALTALNSMMQKGWVDICQIRKVGDLLGVTPSGDAYSILDALHCVHFDKMPEELRERIPELVRECLGVAPTYQFATLRPRLATVEVMPERAEPEQRRGFWRGLLP